MFPNSVIYAFGDSFTEGNGSNGSNSYVQILGTRYGCTVSNSGVGGTGISRAVTNAYVNLPAESGRSGRNITLMAGFNDVSRFAGQPTLDKIEGEITAFLANAFLGSSVSANSVTKSGTWATATTGTWREKFSGNALFNYGGSASLSWTFSGDSVVIGTWDTSGTQYQLSPFEVRIDGVLVETYSPQGKTDGNALAYAEDVFSGLSHRALVYAGLGAGSHTVEVRALGPNYTFVDYFGTLANPSQCARVLVGDIPRLNAAGYALLPLRNTIIDDRATAVIRSCVFWFKSHGFPAYSVPTNGFYDIATGVNADNVHPNPRGHAQIARAFCNGW